MGDLKHELEVYVRASLHQRSLKSLEPSMVIVLDLLWIGIIECKSQFDIVDFSLGIVHPGIFTLKQVVSLVFLGHHILWYLLFLCAW